RLPRLLGGELPAARRPPAERTERPGRAERRGRGPVMSLSVSTPSDTEVVLTRMFAAPPARVFAAFTQPNLLRRWHGARGWNLVVCEVDLRPGGAWRFVSRNQDSGAEMTMSGLYREVERPTRIVNTETHDDWTEGTALITTVFDERDGRTAMATTAR